MNYTLTILSALVPTILIELGVLWLLLERRRRVLLSSVAVNVLTNVPLNIYFIYRQVTWGSLLIAELLVAIVEALWYLWFTRSLRQSLVYSLLCNGFSFLLGILFQLVCVFIDN